MRSLADQTLAELGGRRSVLAKQRADHAELHALLQGVSETSGTEQDDALQRTWRLVFPHAYAEETVLWPALRAVVPDGEQVTLRNEQEHQEINELASGVDRTPPGPERDALLGRLRTLLDEDVRDEEDVLLPRLQQALTPAQLRRLGLLWELVRRTAPTRPHARVSRRPPGNVLSAVPLTLLDRTRDVLDDAARRSSGAPAAASRAASRGLAALAAGVENVGVVQRGQRPSTAVPRTDVPS